MSELQLLKGLHAEFTPSEWDGVDTSGIRPVGPTVVVLCDVCSEISSGGAYLPIDYVRQQTLGSEQGVIVAIAKGAFVIHEDGSVWRDEKPKPGDRVYFEKYAGRLAKGQDGREYRIMDYKCIGALYEANVPAADPSKTEQKAS
jgi:chaperonin GroES